MRALRLDVHGVERLAGGHEQAVAFLTAETDVGADFRQQDHPDALAFGRKNVHAVVAVARPARRGPEVAIDVAADAVGAAIAAHRPLADFCFDLSFRHGHVSEPAAVLQFPPVHDLERLDVPRLAGVGDIELLVVGRET